MAAWPFGKKGKAMSGAESFCRKSRRVLIKEKI
jgi:hypothetical protein